MSTVAPRVVVVTRKTDYERLLERHATRQQARFFLESRGQALEDVVARHERSEEALGRVLAAIPVAWRRTRVDRGDLDRFLFEPQDTIVVVGQDGLVANVAKYLDGQLVLGVNPDPQRNDGVLVPHSPEAAAGLLPATAMRDVPVETRCMVEASLDGVQRILALNELFVGHRTHQSARYRLRFGEREERQSSSGLIVATGTGATGWARSIHRERRSPLSMPAPEEPGLVFFVREAFPSVATGTEITEGRLADDGALVVTSEMNEGGVIFGDGIEADRIEFAWGMTVRVGVSARCLRMVAA